MSTQPLVFALVTFLHDLFTAVWIGGLIATGVAFLPAARQAFGQGPETKKLMDTVQRRQSLLVYVSIVGLAITGALQANRNPAYQGLFDFSTAYSAFLALKHVLVLVMVAIALYRSLVLGRRQGPLTTSRERLSVRLLFLNIVLGIAVLLVSGVIVALGAGPPLA